MFNWYFASGDMSFFWKEQIAALSWLPQVYQKNIGFGFNGLLSLWFDYPFRVFIKFLSDAGLSWFVIEKFLWVSVFAIAIYSSYKLTKSFLGSFIYVTNTYMLLLFAGGQLGVAWGYALAPFVLYKFFSKRWIVNGLWFALLVACDLRIAFLIAAAILLYYVIEKKFDYVIPFLLSLGVAASVHLYWILPTVLASRGTASLGEKFTGPGMLKFLSFADFSHSISLLHPNWPDNLFGKVYFLQPEFLLIPILAFASLFFIKHEKENKNYVIFFALMAFIGAFFAKGVNDPFGGIFAWMFVHVPGFVMFRDPTKFYMYTAIGYSVLIPIFLRKINNKIITIFFLLFWLFTLRGFRVPVMPLPNDYVMLKNMLVSDPVPSRTLWISAAENFAYSSDTHPFLTATSAAAIDPSVRYVIVPEDSAHRIFLNDYTYYPAIRQNLIASIKLPRDPRFTNLAVFENPGFNGMHTSVPAEASRQQNLSDIGVGISIVFLALWILWIYLH